RQYRPAHPAAADHRLFWRYPCTPACCRCKVRRCLSGIGPWLSWFTGFPGKVQPSYQRQSCAHSPAKLPGRDRGRICTAPGSIGVPPYIALPLTAWPVLPTIPAPALLATQSWTTERAADGDGTSLDTGPQRRWRDERMHMDRNSEVRSTLRPQESDIGQELLRLFLHKHRPVPKRPAFSRTSTIIVRKELLPFYYAIYDHDLCRFVELQYRN